MIGQRLGPYEVLAKLGEGGMGEVYRARDTKLNRDVAIKILPDAFASDADRVARFTREAQTLATLNHPHIAQIYGFEQAGATSALVMELVEGEDLAQRIARGPIPLDEALAFARQIADALEAAHEKGIIHRDLKPANIKLTPDGRIKVLDFGLAKALESTSAVPSSISMSPTVTAGTQLGVILGTAAYMAPEQARGKAVDKRADIWAFGCVLYEMLAGRAAFGGSDVTEILASVVKTEPDWTALPASTPSHVRHVLERCLRKDPAHRLHHIADVRLELEEAPSAAAPESASPARSRRPLGWIVASVACFLVAALLGAVHFLEQPTAVRTMRFQIPVPDTFTEVRDLSLSPDGTRLAFVARAGQKTQLWVRPLDSVAPEPLTGTADLTEGAASPFWSPDNRFVAFFAPGKLKKVGAAGGPPQILCDADGVGGGTWNADGTILFAPNARGLYRVSSAGGVATPVTSIDPSTELAHRNPQFLPDGRHFIYQVAPTNRNLRSVVVASLDDPPDSKERRRLLNGTYGASYSAGHLLYERDGVLMAQPFDAARLELRGEPFPVAQEVKDPANPTGVAPFSASLEGTLAYVNPGDTKTQLAWFDRAGRELQRVGEPANQQQPKLSPDGNRLAIARQDARAQWDLWIVDLTRDTAGRLTFGQGSGPVWAPDGTRILFQGRRASDTVSLYLKIQPAPRARRRC